MLDHMLCKIPCYETTHNTEYKKNISNNLYSHIKSKYKITPDSTFTMCKNVEIKNIKTYLNVL